MAAFDILIWKAQKRWLKFERERDSQEKVFFLAWILPDENHMMVSLLNDIYEPS
jgi:hypothetical protein